MLAKQMVGGLDGRRACSREGRRGVYLVYAVRVLVRRSSVRAVAVGSGAA